MSMSRAGWDNQRGRVPATFDSTGRGAGYVIPIIPRTDFNFDGRASTSQYIPVAVGIDASAWVSGVLMVRMHAKNSWGAGTKVQVVVDNILIVPEEPDVIFAPSATLASPVAMAEFVEATDFAPALKVTALNAPIGSMLRVHVRWVQSTAGTAQTVSLGIDLVGRPA